jgi:hypothetical protein
MALEQIVDVMCNTLYIIDILQSKSISFKDEIYTNEDIPGGQIRLGMQARVCYLLTFRLLLGRGSYT